jgi:leader peptidase (prepilin peptidase)/N-methyltransferase
MISSLIFTKESEDLEVFNISLVVILGLVFGSFLAMLVYRLPLGLSLLNPKRSFCPKCESQIQWYENIPLFSYLFLKGKCSQCKTKISKSYFIIELVTVIVTICLFLKLGFNYQFFFILLLSYTLIVLSFIDLKYKAVPDYLLVLALFVAFVYLLAFKSDNIMMLFLFAGGIVILEIFVTFYIQNIKSKFIKNENLEEQKSLGEGDIPIFAIIGGVLGLKLGLFAIFLSAILAIIPSVLNIIRKKEIETPFIPFLSIGFFIVFLSEVYIIEMINIGYGK